MNKTTLLVGKKQIPQDKYYFCIIPLREIKMKVAAIPSFKSASKYPQHSAG